MRYHLRIRTHANGLPPCHAVTIGKLDFRVYTTRNSPFVDKGHASYAAPSETYRGAVGEYSEQDINDFREKVQHFVVRWAMRDKDGVPEPFSATLYDTRISEYVADFRDEPLEPWLEVVPLAMDVPAALAGHVTPEQTQALNDAAAREAEVRASDPTDAQRRKRHGRAKGAGEGVDA